MKQTLILALAAMLAGSAGAATLSPDEALARLGGGAVPQSLTGAAAPRLAYTAATEAGEPAVYLFAKGEKGYMLLSADDAAYPLLGYADNGRFDADNMAPAMRWWLEEYARQIAWAREQGIDTQSAREPKADRHDVAALIKTRWDQGEPYNQMSPIVNGERAYTGCVATSMAQIMNYFKYPECGRGKISYSDNDGCGKRLTWDFADHPFEWDNMLNLYRPGEYDEDQAFAVAELMKSCGASVKMSYGADASGAMSMYTSYALVKYFDYDPNVSYQLRSFYPASQWDEMMYDNIANCGPVLYGGGSMIGGGHSFIVDGYDAATGFYHFNWGWSEMSDGFYSLDALNPTSLGAGGGDGGGFNFTQDAVLGIQPPTGKPATEKPIYIVQQGGLGGSIEDGKLTVAIVEEAQPMWINYSAYDLDALFGVSFRAKGAADTDTTLVVVSPLVALPVGYGVASGACKPIDLAALDLADGEYKLTMESLVTNLENQTWQPVRENWGYSNSMTLTKTGDKYELSVAAGKLYTVDEISLEYELYYGCLMKMHYKLTNNTDIEISRGIAPIFYNTSDYSAAYLGNSKMVSIKPGETVEGDLVTELYAMTSSIFGVNEDVPLYMSLFDETSYRMLFDQVFARVTLHPNPGAPSVKLSPSFGIDNAEWNAKQRLWEVYDPADMQLYTALHLEGGYVAYPLYAVVLGLPDANGNAEIIDMVGENVFMEDPDVPFEFEHSYNFKAGVPGNIYGLMLAWAVGNNLSPIESSLLYFKVMQYSGIEDVAADEAAAVEYYNLQGVRVDYDTAPAGIYLRHQGNTTVKVIKK